jgi:hypothetical protein
LTNVLQKNREFATEYFCFKIFFTKDENSPSQSFILATACNGPVQKVQSCGLATAVMVLYKSIGRRNLTGTLFSSQWRPLQHWKTLLGVFELWGSQTCISWFNAKLCGNFGVGWSSDTFVWVLLYLTFSCEYPQYKIEQTDCGFELWGWPTCHVHSWFTGNFEVGAMTWHYFFGVLVIIDFFSGGSPITNLDSVLLHTTTGWWNDQKEIKVYILKLCYF